MIQTKIIEEEEETNIERLKRIRMIHYKDLIKTLKILQIQKDTSIKTFNLIVKDIDKDIEKEKIRQKTLKG